MKTRTLLALVACLILTAPSWTKADRATDAPPRVIAGFGSSVCRGAGDHLEQGGYIGRLGALLGERGWTVIDASRNGDNTERISERWEPAGPEPSRPVLAGQYLLPHKPGYALIGLSLGNEGIVTPDSDKREAVFEQFSTGLQAIIARCRAQGIQPVVVNCYPRMDYRPAEYEATQRMNLLINSWDVPSVNMLGALDDGRGRWATGFRRDKGHPHGGGHDEMFLSVVPTLFDAIESGKPTPQRAETGRYVHVDVDESPALTFTPADQMHSFATAFWFRTTQDGVLARVRGLAGQAVVTREDFGEAHRVTTTKAALSGELWIKDGRLVYQSGSPAELRSVADVADGRWHMVLLSHLCAQGRTTVYLDGQPIARIEERIIPKGFELGIDIKADLRDWFVWRAAVSDMGAAALQDGAMIQSSLEVYTPLADEVFTAGAPVENRAQSLSRALVGQADIESRTDVPGGVDETHAVESAGK